MRKLRTLVFASTAIASSAGLLLLTGCSDSTSAPAGQTGGLDGSPPNGSDSGPSANDGADAADAADATDATTATVSDAGEANDATTVPLDDASGDARGPVSDGPTGVVGEAGSADASSEASACPAAPQLSPPQSDAGIYCPFSATEAGDQSCTRGSQMCCVSPSSSGEPSSCQPFGASCPAPVSNFAVWQCSAPQDCVGAPVDGGNEAIVCCLLSGYAETTNSPACPVTYKTAGGFDSVTCMAASQCAGTMQVPNPASDAGGSYTDYLSVVCEADTDCVAAGAGSTCTPVKVSGVGIGLCSLELK